MRCQRCGEETQVTTMSRFNTQTICMDCEMREEKHPDYVYAKAMELYAVQRGDYNYPGVGWPGEDGRVRR